MFHLFKVCSSVYKFLIALFISTDISNLGVPKLGAPCVLMAILTTVSQGTD